MKLNTNENNYKHLRDETYESIYDLTNCIDNIQKDQIEDRLDEFEFILEELNYKYENEISVSLEYLIEMGKVLSFLDDNLEVVESSTFLITILTRFFVGDELEDITDSASFFMTTLDDFSLELEEDLESQEQYQDFHMNNLDELLDVMSELVKIHAYLYIISGNGKIYVIDNQELNGVRIFDENQKLVLFTIEKDGTALILEI